MNAVSLNRALIALAAIGIFIAGVLTYTHYLEILPPCGASGGCALVAAHPSSFVMVKPVTIPVSLVGLVGYICLFGLAAFRGLTQNVLNRKLVAVGYVASAVGALYSLYLQWVSFNIIHAKCEWCMSSAALMVVTFLVYTSYFTFVTQQREDRLSYPTLPDRNISIASIILLAIGLGFMATRPKGFIKPPEEVVQEATYKLIPDKRNQIGPDDAPITIVEFADLVCPSCRANMPRVKELQKKYPNKIRLIYRHFPLIMAPGHEMAAPAALTAEYAADKGKFWEFVLAFTADKEPAKTIDEVYAYAQQVGLDTTELKKILEKPDGTEQFKRLSRDFEDVEKIGIDSTPTFLVVVKGLPTKKMNPDTMFQEIENGQYKNLIKD